MASAFTDIHQNGVYYALLKHRGKQKRTPLETTDKAIAKRKLSDLEAKAARIDFSAGRRELGLQMRTRNLGA